MTRECHVRICGGLGGKFPGLTRRACGGRASWCFSWPSLAGREALIRAGSVSGAHVKAVPLLWITLCLPSAELLGWFGA
jgi:hypothetical protein